MPRDRERVHEKKMSPKAMNIFGKINSDIRALNSSVLILSQKMKYIVRNEKILGRNLVVLNKRLREMESRSGGSGAGEGDMSPLAAQNELAAINSRLEEHSGAVEEIRSELESMKNTFAKQQDVKEMKYVLDAINPLEFVTRKDLEEISGKKLKGKK